MSERSPQFSVVIPTYNRAALVVRAIRSVLQQSLRDHEVIVVDDCSPDRTKQAVAKLHDPRVRYYRRPQNGGAGAALNSGFELARGRLIAILGDDDEYLPGFLQATLEADRSAPAAVGLFWTGTEVVRDDPEGSSVVSRGFWSPSFRDRDHAYRSFIARRCIGTNCGVTLRRSVLEKVGSFDERMRKAEDTDFLIRVVREFDFRVIPEPLVRVHLHAGPRLTTYDSAMAEAYELIAEKNRETLDRHPRIGALTDYKIAWIYYRSGHKSRARRFLLRSLRQNPAALKTWGIGLLYECLGKRGWSVHRSLSGLGSGAG